MLLGPTQQPLPDSVRAELESALQVWEGGDADAAHEHLAQASQLARHYGYV